MSSSENGSSCSSSPTALHTGNAAPLTCLACQPAHTAASDLLRKDEWYLFLLPGRCLNAGQPVWCSEHPALG